MAGAAARRDSLMSPRVAVLGCLSLSLLGLLALGTPRIAHARRGDADGIHLTVAGPLIDGTVPKDSRPMPRMGFGTCCRASASGEPLVASILTFLAQGGRLIDTAQMYENHRDVATAIARSAIPRSELWITSKVRTIDTSLNHAATVAEVDKILAELKLEQLDLLLLHHAKGNGAKARAAQWQALLEVAKAGKARHVGVSNYDLAQLKGLQACW